MEVDEGMGFRMHTSEGSGGSQFIVQKTEGEAYALLQEGLYTTTMGCAVAVRLQLSMRSTGVIMS